jgi:hypothetical protein
MEIILKRVFICLLGALVLGTALSCSNGGNPSTQQLQQSPAAPSGLTYAQTSIVVTVGQAITSDTPTVAGTVTTWSISPALPAGLSFNSATGVISGTPTSVSALTTYTITASNSGGSTQATVQFTANIAAPSGLSYAQTSIVATVAQAITADTPTITGTVTTWSVAPSLPNGLTLNTTSGLISGIPTVASAQTSYTITAGNVTGSVQTNVQITVNAAVLKPTSGQAASVVIGQPDFTSNAYNQNVNSGTRAYALGLPIGNPVVADGVLFLPDRDNNRVLAFNTVPTSNDASADFVIGQSSLTSNGVAYPVAANNLYGPQTVKTYGGKLFVLDRGDERLLIWNSIPSTNGVSADVVVGQTGFTSSSMPNPPSASTLANPESFEVADGKLIVSDTQNSRVLIWNSIPTTNGASADVVLGQGDFVHYTGNDDGQTGKSGPPTGRTLNEPAGVWSDGTRLIVADMNNNRVLIWYNIPTTNFAYADLVLGQGDFNHNAGNDDNQDGNSDANPSARTLYGPYMLDSNGAALVVADTGNDRVLIWNTIPTANFVDADVVLGQQNFTSAQISATSSQTLYTPAGVYIYGSQLFVTDMNNNRYLIFNSQ